MTLKEKRLSKIIELVNDETSISIAELSQRLQVSYMTIWRDVQELDQVGLLRRTRGGALSIVKPPGEGYNNSFIQLALIPPVDDHKLSIARYAATELVKDGDNILVEAGSTASSMIPFLHQSNLTVLTNGLAAALYAVQRTPAISLICSGGVLIDTGAFIGPQTEEFFAKFRVNKAFFGAQGVTLEDGFTDPTPLYSQLKCTMKRNADQAIMLIDSSKFGVSSLVKVMCFDDVDIIVTDADAPLQFLDGFRQKGIDVYIAP